MKKLDILPSDVIMKIYETCLWFYDSRTVDSYCSGPRESSGVTLFRIVARIKSGKVFEYASDTGLSMIGNFGVSANVRFIGIGYTKTWSYGYYSVNNERWSWIN